MITFKLFYSFSFLISILMHFCELSFISSTNIDKSDNCIKSKYYNIKYKNNISIAKQKLYVLETFLEYILHY